MEQSTYYLFAAVAACAAATGFIYTVVKGALDQRRSREVSARAAWEGYLEMAFENPKLSRAAVDPGDLDDWERYEWFVSRMLYAAEEVLLLSKDDDTWHGAIASQIAYHEAYLSGDGRQYIAHYSKRLQEIIAEAIPFARTLT